MVKLINGLRSVHDPEQWPYMWGSVPIASTDRAQSRDIKRGWLRVPIGFDNEYDNFLVLQNRNGHVYASRHYQENLSWLRYKSYWGRGNWFGNVHIQHLGHLYGIKGGPARVMVNGRHLYMPNNSIFYFVRYKGVEYLFRQIF